MIKTPNITGVEQCYYKINRFWKVKTKSTSSYNPCRVTYLERGLAWAGWASCWAPAHPYTLVLRGARFWAAGAAVWPAGIVLPRDVTFSLGKQFLSLLTPAIALLDVKFSPSNQCCETEIPWQNPSLLWEEGTAEVRGTIAGTEEGTQSLTVSVPPQRGLWLQALAMNPHLTRFAEDCVKWPSMQVQSSPKCSPQDSFQAVPELDVTEVCRDWCLCHWGFPNVPCKVHQLSQEQRAHNSLLSGI